MTKISEADEILIKSNIELTISLENMAEQLKKARANICESCVSTTESFESMDYQIEESERLMVGMRARITSLESELEIANSYGAMSNLMLKKESEVNL